MLFSEFFYDWEIKIEEVFDIDEQLILGWDHKSNTYQKKFRITISYPRSKKSLIKGLFDTETYYVAANNKNEAKEKIISYINNKIKYKEKPKINFTKWKELSSWNDLVELFEYIEQNKISNPISFLNSVELGIFLKSNYQRTNYEKLLSSLSINSQKLLKKFISMNLDGVQTPQNSLYLDRKKKEDKSHKEWIRDNLKNYGRVGWKGRSYKEIEDDLGVNEHSPISSIIREGQKLGISRKTIEENLYKMFDNDISNYQIETEAYDEKLNAYNYVAELVKSRNGGRLPKFGDLAPDELSKKFGSLDGNSTEAAAMYPNIFNTKTRYIDPESYHKYDYTNNEYDDVSVEEQMWELVSSGRPQKPKIISKNEMYYKSLVDIIEDIKTGNVKQDNDDSFEFGNNKSNFGFGANI